MQTPHRYGCHAGAALVTACPRTLACGSCWGSCRRRRQLLPPLRLWWRLRSPQPCRGTTRALTQAATRSSHMHSALGASAACGAMRHVKGAFAIMRPSVHTLRAHASSSVWNTRSRLLQPGTQESTACLRGGREMLLLRGACAARADFCGLFAPGPPTATVAPPAALPAAAEPHVHGLADPRQQQRTSLPDLLCLIYSAEADVPLGSDWLRTALCRCFCAGACCFLLPVLDTEPDDRRRSEAHWTPFPADETPQVLTPTKMTSPPSQPCRCNCCTERSM
jgi:hypothetical protein